MRSFLAGLAGLGVLVGVIGCSSSSGSADNQQKLAKPPDPKLQPTPAAGGAGSPKAVSQ